MVYIADRWHEELRKIGLDTFETLWQLNIPRVDEPNIARGGWSEVCRYELPSTVQQINALYIKRQENFTTFSWRSPLSGDATFKREFNNLLFCREQGIPVVSPVFFAEEKDKRQYRAILVTASLDDMCSLDKSASIKNLEPGQRRALIRVIAQAVKQLHQLGYQHGCLYPKHIYYRFGADGRPEIRFIDLEKLARNAWYKGGIYRDLDTLFRRSYDFSTRDKLCFLQAYAGRDRRLIRKIIQKLS